MQTTWAVLALLMLVPALPGIAAGATEDAQCNNYGVVVQVGVNNDWSCSASIQYCNQGTGAGAGAGAGGAGADAGAEATAGTECNQTQGSDEDEETDEEADPWLCPRTWTGDLSLDQSDPVVDRLYRNLMGAVSDLATFSC